MFDDQDPERLANVDMTIPDGIIDGTQYANIMENIINSLSELDTSQYVSGITWVMRCVNECYPTDEGSDQTKISPSRATDAVTALAYLVMTMTEVIDEDDFKEYIRHQQEVVIPELYDGCKTIPYYDINDDVNRILEMMDNFEVDEIIEVDDDE